MSDEKNMFQKLYKATKEIFDAVKMPLIERALKRKFQEAVDSAESQKLDAEIAMQKLQENIQNYDLNEYLKQKAKIEAAERTSNTLRAHYEELFGEKLS